MVKAWHVEPTKRLICNSQTGQYLTASGHWTGDPEEAKDFPSIFQALEFCCKCQITEAELIFKFGEGPNEVSIPLDDSADGEELAFTEFDQDWSRLDAPM